MAQNELPPADQLIVRVGKACNFKCNFCNVSDNESNVNFRESIKDIVRNFHYKLLYSNYDSGKIIITISGWEPSIFQKETIFAIRYIQQFLQKKWVEPLFEIQTNASCINSKFAHQLSALWVKSALVSFHAINPHIFEKIIQIPYKSFFHKIIEWIEYLHNAGISVQTNTILSSQNQSDFLPTIYFLNERFPFISLFHIWLIQPHGEAKKILEEIYPRYEIVQSQYNRALHFLQSHGKIVSSHFVWLPLCYMGVPKNSLEFSENILFRKNFNFSKQYLITSINDENKIQTVECQRCLFNNVCSGIWKEYSWLQKLNPTQYDYVFENHRKNNEPLPILTSIEDSLKRFYDKNLRQIIIPTSLGSKKHILNFLRTATQMGFYKVTLFIDSDFDVDPELLQTGVGNIQVNIDRITPSMIHTVLEFSKKYSPQFRIDLDISVTTADGYQKLRWLLPFLPNNFIRIFCFKYEGMPNLDLIKYANIIDRLFITGNIYSMDFQKKTLFRRSIKK